MSNTKGPWHTLKEVTNRFDSMTGEPIESSRLWINFGEGQFDNLALICDRGADVANLMAAAPEMLGALEAILDLCASGPCKTIKDEYGYTTTYVSSDDIKSIVKEIIAKAKGVA